MQCSKCSRNACCLLRKNFCRIWATHYDLFTISEYILQTEDLQQQKMKVMQLTLIAR